MNQSQLKLRTKEFAKRVIDLCRKLPNNQEGSIIGRQLFRSATSVGANYRSACRAQSRADYIAKLFIVLEETDESQYWLEIISEKNIMKKSDVELLIKESNELISIMVTTIKKLRQKSYA